MIMLYCSFRTIYRFFIFCFLSWGTVIVAEFGDNLSPQDRLINLLSSPITSFAAQYSCIPSSNSNKKLNDFHIRGTALGGWLVIEPWLTPSLFYQFLGISRRWGDSAKDHVGIDSRTFCTALGSKEANRQLRNHWKTWVTEEKIQQLAESGVDHLRIPVADWMFTPYEPFIGCWDGAIDELDRVLELCRKYSIKVLIDLHALRKSQNGLDNSGDTGHYEWIGNFSSSGAAVYQHWLLRGGDWAGAYDVQNGTYRTINSEGINNSLRVVYAIVDRYKDHPVVMGVEPINEPSDHIPIEILKEYYWRTYQIVQLKAPHWLTLLPDSFRLTPEIFGNFLRNCDNFALDTHIYQAWAWENPPEWFQQHACIDKDNLMLMESIGVPIIVGEWSLATDNCAMWLNGFNDNVPGYPKVSCERIQCPAPYMGEGVQPGAPPDPTLPAQDPFGAGGPSLVEYGTCPRDRSFPNEVEDVRKLSYAKLHAFDYQTHGQFFWNFRTEFEPRWDFLKAVELGWIPKHWDEAGTRKEIKHACDAFPPIPAPVTVPVTAPTPALVPPVTTTPMTTNSTMSILLSHTDDIAGKLGTEKDMSTLVRNLYAALITVGIWLVVLALLLGVAAGAVAGMQFLWPGWGIRATEYSPIPDKDSYPVNL